MLYGYRREDILTQYSIVCQVPGAEPYTISAYTGSDLSQILGITQANMHEGSYGWIQECGEASVRVIGQAKAVYADFRPNAAKLHLSEELSKSSQKQPSDLPSGMLVQKPLAHDTYERLSQLPPLLMKVGPYCALIREARDVFIDGYFYACVAMCGISLERFQRDKAEPYGAKREHNIEKVRNILQQNKILSPSTITICKRMAKLRNKYAHGHGLNPKEDALKSLAWTHSFINNETNLMRDYIIVDGILYRNVVGVNKL